MVTRVRNIKAGLTIYPKAGFLQRKLNKLILNSHQGSVSNSVKYTHLFLTIACPSCSIRRHCTDNMASCLQMLKAKTEALHRDSVVWRSVTQYGSCKMWMRLLCQIFEYDTCWHLVRHKHKLLSPHTNVKHPSSWMHARAPAESHINEASLPSPVTTNLRGWVPSVICSTTLPPWGVFQVVTAGLSCIIGALKRVMKFMQQ